MDVVNSTLFKHWRSLMKKIIIVLSLIVFASTAIAHGGGCRKDSPPGQCCHAGSEPYHCH
tara:strand:- start:151 stop:330 length:180 start_codon:yes stop_codon:yes gene_type:complete